MGINKRVSVVHNFYLGIDDEFIVRNRRQTAANWELKLDMKPVFY